MLEEVFGQKHERAYGHRAAPEEPVEQVNAQLVGLGIPDSARIPDKLYADNVKLKAPHSRKAYFDPNVRSPLTPYLVEKPSKSHYPAPQ